jgi:mono/diheme cytochrome c family protein
MLEIKIKSFVRAISLTAVLFLAASPVIAQSDWHVDEAKANIQNPVKVDATSLKEGQILFKANCKTCHGDPGKNNGLPLVPKPTDMSNADFLKINSDGAIFTKMTDGKNTMPTFKAVLSATQRWQIVNYIRSFDPNKKSLVTNKTASKQTAALGAPYSMQIAYDSVENIVTATVSGTTKQGELAPAKEVEVEFFMTRYFGDLPFGEIGAVTDEEGKIQAHIPVDLPGGEDGKEVAYAQISDSDTYGSVSANVEVKVKAVEIVNLLDHRSLWTKRVMAPWWLIFTYFGLLLAVWGTLAYVVFQMFKLKKAAE